MLLIFLTQAMQVSLSKETVLSASFFASSASEKGSNLKKHEKSRFNNLKNFSVLYLSKCKISTYECKQQINFSD